MPTMGDRDFLSTRPGSSSPADAAHRGATGCCMPAAGLAALALFDLLSLDLAAGSMRHEPGSPPAARRHPGGGPATARSVIFLFMEGGPSHIDTFDPKPSSTSSPASRCRPASSR